MAKIVAFDPDTKRGVRIKEITSPWRLSKLANHRFVLVDPLLPVDVAIEHLKLENGQAVEITDAEKDALDDAQQLPQLTTEEAFKLLIAEAKAVGGVESITKRGLVRRLRAMRK